MGWLKKYQNGGYSTTGYKADSPDRNNPYNIIPSGRITMQNVPHPVLGIDNFGNKQMMQPGAEYQFPGETVFEVPAMKEGGIPQRYKNMGFSRVGQKKSGDGQHKWKVLAKKGDSYKVVQGGYRGMQDFKQHHSEERKDRFWDRMGGRDSSKAKDPFSPLYWHKRFGTWEYGGPVPSSEMYKDGGMIRRADGSYSQRGLWDNIRANAGSGKKPTKEMLQQERKIRSAEKKEYGGWLNEYQSGGVATINGNTPTGVSVGTQTYQDIEHKPIVSSYAPALTPQEIFAKQMQAKQNESVMREYRPISPAYREQLEREYKWKEAKQNVVKPLLQGADVVTDVMQLGNFIPHPIAQGIGKVGNVFGTGVDALQAGMDLGDGNYGSAAINAGSMLVPIGLESQVFRRNSKYLRPGQPLYPFSPQASGSSKRVQYIEPFTATRHMTDNNLLANRALLGTLATETAADATQQYGGWLNSYQKGGIASIDNPKSKGTSVGTQAYQDWEHRPMPAPYISDRDRQIQALRMQQANTPAIGAQPTWQQQIYNRQAQNNPMLMNTIGYPLVAAAKLTDPNYSYTNGNSGYGAFSGAGEAIMDVEAVVSPLKALTKKVGSKISIPRGYTGPMMTDLVPIEPVYPTSPYRPPGGRTFPVLPARTPTGMPTLVDVPELTKEQQILKSFGLNYRNNPTAGINTGSNVTPLSEYQYYGNSPTSTRASAPTITSEGIPQYQSPISNRELGNLARKQVQEEALASKSGISYAPLNKEQTGFRPYSPTGTNAYKLGKELGLYDNAALQDINQKTGTMYKSQNLRSLTNKDYNTALNQGQGRQYQKPKRVNNGPITGDRFPFKKKFDMDKDFNASMWMNQNKYGGSINKTGGWLSKYK